MARGLALIWILALATAGCEFIAGTKDRKVGTAGTTGSGGSSTGGTVSIDAGPGTGGIVGMDGPPATGDRPLGGQDAGADAVRATGGVPGAGGIAGAGGVAGAGDVAGTGGAVGTGGVASTGGAGGAGGAGTGGTAAGGSGAGTGGGATGGSLDASDGPAADGENGSDAAGRDASGAVDIGTSGPSCDGHSCDPNATCDDSGPSIVCTCKSRFTGNGHTCMPYPSCLDLHLAEPNLPSGPYTIHPVNADADIVAYCEMRESDGGWTLVFNQGTDFDPLALGSPTSPCYDESCTNASYSTLPVGTDVLMDVADSPIAGAVYLARILITGVHTATRGKAMRLLMTTGPYFLEKEDNSNLSVTVNSALTCNDVLANELAYEVCNSCDTVPSDVGGFACGMPVITLGDVDTLCGGPRFAIGGSLSYTQPWGNCYGWPQRTEGSNGYPSYIRMWVR